MNAARRYERYVIQTCIENRIQDRRRLAGTIDRIVEYLDAQSITPERFRGFSYPAARNAIETALRAVTGGEALE
jgi:hypothetical protein